MRRGELLGLEWKDVDLEGRKITIRQNLVALKGKFVFSEPKTRGSYRTIPFPERALEVLRTWRKKWLEERMALGPGWPETDLVFPTSLHTPMHPRNLLRSLKEILRKADLPQDITIHALRHTYASLLLAQGEHPKVVQELLGHSSISTTLDVYSQIMPGLKEQAAKKIDSLFRGIP